MTMGNNTGIKAFGWGNRDREEREGYSWFYINNTVYSVFGFMSVF